MAKYLTLGKRANIFHDPSVGLTITKGDVKEVAAAILNYKRVKTAIHSGHLVIVDKPVEEKAINLEDVVKGNLEKLSSMSQAGKSIKDIAKAFKLDELKSMAEAEGIEVEDSDTKEDILGVLLDEDDE